MAHPRLQDWRAVLVEDGAQTGFAAAQQAGACPDSAVASLGLTLADAGIAGVDVFCEGAL